MTRNLEARGGIEPPIKVLQTFALPLGDRAAGRKKLSVIGAQLKKNNQKSVERMRSGRVKPEESEASPIQFPALYCTCELLVMSDPTRGNQNFGMFVFGHFLISCCIRFRKSRDAKQKTHLPVHFWRRAEKLFRLRLNL